MNHLVNSEDLPRLLRQISDALWDAAQRKDMGEINSLLDRREQAFKELTAHTPLDDRERRELLAIQAADKYLIRQLDNELDWLNRRLHAVDNRRRAAAGYRQSKVRTTRVSRTG